MPGERGISGIPFRYGNNDMQRKLPYFWNINHYCWLLFRYLCP